VSICKMCFQDKMPGSRYVSLGICTGCGMLVQKVVGFLHLHDTRGEVLGEEPPNPPKDPSDGLEGTGISPNKVKAPPKSR